MKYGIDVSEFTPVPDYKKYDFAIIRLGYGTKHLDNSFIKHYEAAKNAGCKIGIYWFSYAVSVDEANTEANYVIATMQKLGVKPDFPVFFDWEYDSERYAKQIGVTVDNAKLQAITKEWLSIVSNFYKVGIYSNLDFYTHFGSLTSKYPVWLAQLDGNITKTHEILQYRFADTGDLNRCEDEVYNHYIGDIDTELKSLVEKLARLTGVIK